MIVDTSALLAVLFQEEDAADYARAISEAEICRMSAANYLEAGMNVDGQAGPDYGRKLDVFIRETKIILEPVTVEQAYVAREAFVNRSYWIPGSFETSSSMSAPSNALPRFRTL